MVGHRAVRRLKNPSTRSSGLALYLVFLVAILIIATMVYAPIRRRRHRQALAAQPFPRQWRLVLRERWLLYRYLPVDVRFALQRQLQIMMASTEFYGCNGLEVTETMRLLTLAQAALLYRNISQDQLASFPTVLLYPDAFVREGELTDELGLVSRQRHIMLGESWQQGRVILSWSDIEQDLRRLDGHNLVIHEYAHQIDGYDGSMNGVPMLPNETQYRRWTRVMTAAFEDVNHQVQWGESPIDPYASTNPAEFFAVVSEYFFSQPDLLQRLYPEVYTLLAGFYRQQPLEWLGEVQRLGQSTINSKN